MFVPVYGWCLSLRATLSPFPWYSSQNKVCAGCPVLVRHHFLGVHRNIRSVFFGRCYYGAIFLRFFPVPGRCISVKERTPALDYVGLRTVIEWIMVAHVDSSDCRCRCIGKIIARDLRLVASRLYKTGVTRPWTRHVQRCRYIIPLFRCRPPGLQNPVQE